MAIECKDYQTSYKFKMLQILPKDVSKEEIRAYIHKSFEDRICCFYVASEDYCKELRWLGFKKYEDGYYLDNNQQSYIYMIRCLNGHLYTGWTNHLHQRLLAHLNKEGAKYTKAFGPCELVYYETFETKQEAMKREYEIKQYTKKHLIVVTKYAYVHLNVATICLRKEYTNKISENNLQN